MGFASPKFKSDAEKSTKFWPTNFGLSTSSSTLFSKPMEFNSPRAQENHKEFPSRASTQSPIPSTAVNPLSPQGSPRRLTRPPFFSTPSVIIVFSFSKVETHNICIFSDQKIYKGKLWKFQIFHEHSNWSSIHSRESLRMHFASPERSNSFLKSPNSFSLHNE